MKVRLITGHVVRWQYPGSSPAARGHVGRPTYDRRGTARDEACPLVQRRRLAKTWSGAAVQFGPVHEHSSTFLFHAQDLCGTRLIMQAYELTYYNSPGGGDGPPASRGQFKTRVTELSVLLPRLIANRRYRTRKGREGLAGRLA